MENNSKSLTVYEGRQLAEMYLPPVAFCVEGLLPHGLAFLGGPAKYGKSWLVLDLCVRVAKGEPFWNLPVQQSEVLYLALEDSITFLTRNKDRMGVDASANLPSETIRMAMVMVSVLPIACAYPFFQRYFVQGLTVGSVKG